jgi:hypothetical protein
MKSSIDDKRYDTVLAGWYGNRRVQSVMLMNTGNKSRPSAIVFVIRN